VLILSFVFITNDCFICFILHPAGALVLTVVWSHT